MNKMRQQRSVRQRPKRKNARLRQHRRSVLLICMVLVVMSGVLAVSSVKLNAKNAQYKARKNTSTPFLSCQTRIRKTKKTASDS